MYIFSLLVLLSSPFLINAHSDNIFRAQYDSIVYVENDVCVPSFCPTPSANSTDFAKFCQNISMKINSRCCVNDSATASIILGIDYSYCNMEKLSTTIGNLNKSLIGKVEFMDVRRNPLTECGLPDTFAGFLNLNQLYLSDTSPSICECPGGNYSWSNEVNGTCSGRKNICNTNYSPNINCTSNSMCAENGPGNFLCLCKQDFHGYKCLEKGEFPTLIYTSVICLTTLILSAILWQTQRRYVKKTN